MAEGSPVQKSLPHELLERFASEMAPQGLGTGSEEPWIRPGRIGGRMVRVLLDYAEGAPDR